MPRLQTRDIIIHYDEIGKGEPLLLISGLGQDSQAWALSAPDLAKHFRVITFDNRGAGRTSSPDRPYTIDQMADDAAGLLEALEIPKAHVLGWSMGGYIAQELALGHPGLVNKLILLSTAGTIDGYGRAMLASLLTVRRTNISREGFVRMMAPLVYSKAFLDDTTRLERAIQNSASNAYPQQDHAYIRQIGAIQRFDASPRLGEIKAETLVLHGEDDVLVPPHNGEALAAAISGATHTVLPGGHVGVLENPNAYNEAILAFLGAAVPAG